MVLACITLTLAIGLDVWFSTLKTRSNLAVMWNAESSDIQHLLQQRVRPLLIPDSKNLILTVDLVQMLRIHDDSFSHRLDMP